MFLNYDVWDANPPSPRIRFRTKYLSSLHQKNKGKGRVGHDKVHQDDPYVVVCIGGCFSFLRDRFVCVNRVEEQDSCIYGAKPSG